MIGFEVTFRQTRRPAQLQKAYALSFQSSAFEIVCFVLLTIAFWWPGARVMQLWDRDGTLNWGTSIALGFPVAFGVFSALQGPLLVTHRPSSWALTLGVLSWILATAAVELVHVARRRQCRSEPDDTHDPETQQASPSEPLLCAPTQKWMFTTVLLLVASLFVAWSLATEAIPRKVAIALFGLLFATNFAVSVIARRRNAVELAPVESPPTASAKIVSAAVALLLVFQLVSTTICVREDKDDCLYLSAALLLQDEPAMGIEEPSHRGEGLPSNPQYAWQTWELWGALLARVTGVHPLVVFRTLLAPVIVLISFFLYAQILKIALPRSHRAIAMLILLTYLTIGMSSHFSAYNYLLPRPAQGKTWLIHVATPAIIIFALEFVRRPRLSTWLLLLSSSFAALGFAPTAVFLVPSLLGPLLLATLVVTPRPSTLKSVVFTSAAVMPQVIFALILIFSGEASGHEEARPWWTSSRWASNFFFMHLGVRDGGGALELFALMTSPFLLIFLWRRDQWLYPLIFTWLFFATVANPLLYPFVAGPIRGAVGYIRLFWLVPYAILLGALFAGLGSMMSRYRSAQWGELFVVAVAVVMMPIVGGRFVWSSTNRYHEEHVAPYVTSNLYKMPNDLLAVAKTLTQHPQGVNQRILCSERSASHLAPLVKDFCFIYTSGFLTTPTLTQIGRADEAIRRERLAKEFLIGEMDREEATRLLQRERPQYVVLFEPQSVVVDTLRSAGFEESFRSGSYSLWNHTSSDAAEGNRRQ